MVAQMKKSWILFFILLPMMSFGASSVRMLGGTPALTAAAAKTQVTPVRMSSVKASDNSLSSARVGSLSAKVKKNVSNVQKNTQDSRFPVIVPANSYNIISTPDQGTNYNTVETVDVGAIIESVMQNITNNYYNNTEVYNKQEIDEMLDDPRFDAIRIVRRGSNDSEPSNADYPTNLPSNYIYMWIEEN